ncbi:hypothetical protein [Planococcus versutus]|uniref:DUF2711 domain-containing protein n=1 Tax=Planococcus versutus TaxID=1302659 RepID=A0A1B1S2Y4_9BACL|nr:hypothetical protein [Planococcus versutus]ANU27567.1 hypothetical protein I858_011280 [Planococcus versutus]
MKKLSSQEEYEWIREETVEMLLDKRQGIRVENFLPNRFTHYCKMIHPLYRDPQIQDEHLLWSECTPKQAEAIQLGERVRLAALAKKYEVDCSKELSAASLMQKLNAVPRYLITGDEGEIEPDSLNALVRVLHQFSGKESCCFWYEGLKMEEYAAALFHGKLSEVMELSTRAGLRGTPTYWWPANKAWCVYTDTDLDFSVIAGSHELIEALVADDFLECFACDVATLMI